MHFLRHLGTVLLILLALNTSRASPVVASPQFVTLPASAGPPLFADLTGDGRCDLFVIDQAAKNLWIYNQRTGGFTDSPDQIIPLPAQTAWVALGDVDPHPGLELLMSTATGLVYSLQTGGRFESERHTLIVASQVFTNCNYPLLTLLTTNKTDPNILIPVISVGQTVQYHRDSSYQWTPGTPTNLVAQESTWSASHDRWMLGSNPSHSLRVHQYFLTQPEPPDQKPENEAIRKITEDMRKTADAWGPQTSRVDVDGDGREDLVLFQTSGGPDFKTDLYIFLRGADGQLPPRPTQVLHCRGMPISVNSLGQAMPFQDLKGDGRRELVLLEFKTSILSADGLIQTMISHGLDWALTIRPFEHGTTTRSPQASVPVTMTMPAQVLNGWPIFIQGDFNGDGRPDLLVRRSDTQWNIFFSATDGHWFAPQPALTFDTPTDGYMQVKNLNGDGLSDIIWHEREKHRLAIFMSPSRQANSKTP